MEYIEKTLTAIITHNTSSITFTDDFITDDSIIDVYFSSDDIVPTNQEQIGNRLIISIEPKNYDVSIAVHITNDDTINYADELESLSNTVESLSETVEEHTNAIISHDEDITNINGDITALDTKIDGLNASNINYDEHSTIYSAMGDIDTLETTSKNLVGAINEVKESGGGGGITFSSGALTAVNNIRTLGSTRWYKLGKLCIISVEDLQFQSSGSYEGYQNSPIYMSGLPLPVRNYNAFAVRRADNRDAYNTCRLVVSKNNGVGVIKPHYTSVVGNTDNYYGIVAYECAE